MRIALFGGTGPTGIELIKQALGEGIEVVAYARNPQKIEIEDPKLEVIRGTLADEEAIGKCVRGADAVVSLIGVGASTKGTEVSDGIINIVDAMEKEGVTRLIQISTPTYPDANDGKDAYLTFMAKMLKLTSKNIYSELMRYSEAVTTSNLDWTLVRIPFLKDDSPSHAPHVGYKGDKGSSHRLSRANLARFILQIVEDGSYIRQAPYVSDWVHTAFN